MTGRARGSNHCRKMSSSFGPSRLTPLATTPSDPLTRALQACRHTRATAGAHAPRAATGQGRAGIAPFCSLLVLATSRADFSHQENRTNRFFPRLLTLSSLRAGPTAVKPFHKTTKPRNSFVVLVPLLFLPLLYPFFFKVIRSPHSRHRDTDTEPDLLLLRTPASRSGPTSFYWTSASRGARDPKVG